MSDKTITCCFCGFDLLDENETVAEYENVYLCKFTLYQFWVDRHNKIRCCHCDAIIGKRLDENPTFMILWRIHIENENENAIEEEPTDDVVIQFRVLFLDCFAEVRTTSDDLKIEDLKNLNHITSFLIFQVLHHMKTFLCANSPLRICSN